MPLSPFHTPGGVLPEAEATGPGRARISLRVSDFEARSQQVWAGWPLCPLVTPAGTQAGFCESCSGFRHSLTVLPRPGGLSLRAPFAHRLLLLGLHKPRTLFAI